MRSLSKVFKDSDIVVENYHLLLDSIIKNEKAQVSLRTLPADNSLGKKEEVLWQAKLKAYKLIENGMECANSIILKANQKAQDELEQARKNGFQEGYAVGLKKGEERIAAGITEMQLLINSLEEKKAEMLKKYEEELKDLAISIAKKVIDSELDNDNSRFLAIYKNAIKQHSKQAWVKITVSEYEADFAIANKSELMALAKGAKDIKIIVDSNACRGTCIVETPSSVVDASVDTQLNRLKEMLSESENQE